MELNGLAESLRKHFESFKYPILGVNVKFLDITSEEEEKVTNGFVEVYGKDWSEIELDLTIAYLESPAGRKLLDHNISESAFKVFDDFLKLKLENLPRPKKTFITPGNNTIN